MSEIEKMYENANIEKEVIKGCYEYYAENGGIDIYTVNDCKNKDCNTCKADKSIKEYPPFTAEKQIELIKWLAYKMHITIGKGLPWGQYDDDWWTVTDKKGYVGTNAYKFEEALANFVNSLWQLLTEEEKQQVKGIME